MSWPPRCSRCSTYIATPEFDDGLCDRCREELARISKKSELGFRMDVEVGDIRVNITGKSTDPWIKQVAEKYAAAITEAHKDLRREGYVAFFDEMLKIIKQGWCFSISRDEVMFYLTASKEGYNSVSSSNDILLQGMGELIDKIEVEEHINEK